jgi:RNA polymerase sigma factor (sigma-70 family)
LTETTDADLVVAFLNGDDRAYTNLVERHWRRIFSIAYSVLGNASDSEDIAQETIMRGFERMGSLKKPEKFSGWISQIAKNLALDFLRKSERKNRQLNEDHQIIAAPRESDNRDLNMVIAKLPLKFRQTLMLYYFNGENSSEVAELLGLTAHGVRSRLRRARVMLHKLLTEGGENGK